jgi:hypothetical protein
MVTLALRITGYCKDDVNPLGPVQEYVPPGTGDENKCKSLPTQRGPLLLMVAPSIQAMKISSPPALVKLLLPMLNI